MTNRALEGQVLNGYVRVSQVGDRGGPSFISPQVQREQIEAWAKLSEARIGEVFEELNESGGRVDRPKLLSGRRGRHGRASLLGGILCCGSCRMKMTSSMGQGKDRMVRPSYMCPRHSSGGDCPDPARVRSDEIEGLFEELVIRESRRSPDRHAEARISKAGEALAEAERSLVSYRDDAGARSALGTTRFAEGLRRRGAEVERRALLLADARKAARRPEDVPEEIEECWPSLTIAERREVIERFVDCGFVMAGSEPATRRVHVCRRGEQPPDTPARGYRIGAIRPFDPSTARTVRLPSPAIWPEHRIERELRAWGAGRLDWPGYAEFLRDGRARLYLQVCGWGGPTYWSRRLGWQMGQHPKYFWTPERVRGALRPYLRDREDFPTRREWIELGAASIRKAVEVHGGVGFWAAEFGVAFKAQMVRAEPGPKPRMPGPPAVSRREFSLSVMPAFLRAHALSEI